MKKEMNWKGSCCEKPFYGIPIIGAILVLAVICISGCVGMGLAPPIVSDVPNNWYISDEAYYGYYEGVYDYDGAGMIEFTDSVDNDFIQIYYEYAPQWGLYPTDLEDNAIYFIGEVGFNPNETGTMSIAGTVAGYAKSYDVEFDCYILVLSMILDEVYFEIFSCYDVTPENVNQVMSLIESISVGK